MNNCNNLSPFFQRSAFPGYKHNPIAILRTTRNVSKAIWENVYIFINAVTFLMSVFFAYRWLPVLTGDLIFRTPHCVQLFCAEAVLMVPFLLLGAWRGWSIVSPFAFCALGCVSGVLYRQFAGRAALTDACLLLFCGLRLASALFAFSLFRKEQKEKALNAALLVTVVCLLALIKLLLLEYFT